MTVKILKAIFLLFCLLFGLVVRGQKTISGKIVDDKNTPVTYAIITLKHIGDSTIIKNEVTDSLGNYSIIVNSISHSFLTASATGFAEQSKVVSDLNQRYDFTLVEQSTLMNEVVISGSKPLIERKIDRTIFNVSQSIAAIGGDAIDAIKKAPGVNVNGSDITLIGKSSTNILINDKLIQLSGEDLINYLKAIPSDNISRIEVITTPPAQYDAAGNSGLINIVLKKDKTNGVNGNVRTGYQQASLGTVIAGGNINYHKGKVSANAGVNYNYGAVQPSEHSVAYFPLQTFESKDNRKDTRNFLQANFGIDYTLHKGGVFGFQYVGAVAHPNISEQNNTWVMDKYGTLDSILTTNAFNTRKYQSNSINLNYVWDIDTSGKKLNINLNRMWYNGDQNRLYVSKNYIDAGIPTGTESNNKTLGNPNVNITTAQLDITHPTPLITLTYGSKLSFIRNNSGNTLWVLDNDEYRQDISLSNQFNYEEKIQALYLSVSKDIGKWSFQAGLRGEFTQTKGESIQYDQVNTNHYFQLFPTAYMQYNINDNNVLNINYSKRIQRPGYSSLDPFRWYITPYSYAEGNPFLKPSFNHNVEFSYTYKQRYTFSAYYQKSVQAFSQVSLLDTIHNIQYFKKDNLGSVSSYGITAGSVFNPTHWWEVQIEASGYYSHLSSAYYDGIKKAYGKSSFSMQSNNSFTFNKSKTFLGELSFDYSSPFQSEYYEVKATGSINAGIKLLLLDKKLVVTLNANDLLATERYRAKNIYNQTTLNNYNDSRSLRLMLNYKFGSNKLKEARRRETGIEAEAGRTN